VKVLDTDQSAAGVILAHGCMKLKLKRSIGLQAMSFARICDSKSTATQVIKKLEKDV